MMLMMSLIPYRYDIMAADLPRASSRFQLLLQRLTLTLI
jgi:hypothetical protein